MCSLIHLSSSLSYSTTSRLCLWQPLLKRGVVEGEILQISSCSSLAATVDTLRTAAVLIFSPASRNHLLVPLQAELSFGFDSPCSFCFCITSSSNSPCSILPFSTLVVVASRHLKHHIFKQFFKLPIDGFLFEGCYFLQFSTKSSTCKKFAEPLQTVVGTFYA